MNWTISHLHRRALRSSRFLIRFPFSRGLGRSRKRSLCLSHDGFHQLYGCFIGSSADISGTDIVVISLHAGQVAVDLDTVDPIFSWPGSEGVLLRREIWIRRRRRGRSLAEVVHHLAAIGKWIERRNHCAAVSSLPNSHIEWNTFRSFFRRVRTAHVRRWLPCRRELLRRKSFHSGMMQNAGQGSGKSKAVRQHILITRNTEVAPEIIISIEDLANDRLGIRGIHVTLFHRRARGKPPAGRYILFQFFIVRREVFFHQAIAVRAGKVENIVRILLEEREVIAHRLTEILLDGLRVLPPPLCIEVRVAHCI